MSLWARFPPSPFGSVFVSRALSWMGGGGGGGKIRDICMVWFSKSSYGSLLKRKNEERGRD